MLKKHAKLTIKLIVSWFLSWLMLSIIAFLAFNCDNSFQDSMLSPGVILSSIVLGWIPAAFAYRQP
jgi:hypothetical protein